MNNKDEIIDKIISREGGYVFDPKDSGGETNYGITLKVARKNGYKGQMKDFPKWLAFDIYEKRYLKKIKFDDMAIMSPLIAEELADTSVNMGTKRAGQFLQESLNVLNRGGKDYTDVVEDGKIGQKTLTSLSLFLKKRGVEGEGVLHSMLNALQGAFYVKLCQRRVKDERFVFGWFRTRIAW